MLANNNGFNINYEKPCQQIAIVNINKLCKSSILSYFIGQFILLDYGTDSFIPIYVYTPTIIRTDQHILMINDIRQYVNQTPSALLHKDRIDIGTNMVSITTTNCAMHQDWKSYVVNELPNIEMIPRMNVNGALTNVQTEMVQNAVNNAQNRISDKQQFRHNDNNNNNNKKNGNSNKQKNKHISLSANNSPNIQPQPSDIDIIPLISVSQMSINQQKPVNAYSYIDANKMMDHLYNDRFKILLRILRTRIQPYNPDKCNEVAMYMMNYDHIQIIAALNNQELLFQFISNIILVYNHIKNESDEYKQQTALWDHYVKNFDKSMLNMMHREI